MFTVIASSQMLGEEEHSESSHVWHLKRFWLLALPLRLLSNGRGSSDPSLSRETSCSCNAMSPEKPHKLHVNTRKRTLREIGENFNFIRYLRSLRIKIKSIQKLVQNKSRTIVVSQNTFLCQKTENRCQSNVYTVKNRAFRVAMTRNAGIYVSHGNYASRREVRF